MSRSRSRERKRSLSRSLSRFSHTVFIVYENQLGLLKLAPYGVNGQLLRMPPPSGEWYCNSKSICKLLSLKSRDTKTRTDIKNLLRTNTKVIYCSVVSESVVICQLTLKMWEEIDFENRRISNFKGLFAIDLGSGHTAYRRASLIDLLPIYQISSESEKLFVDGRTRPILLDSSELT